VRRDVSLVLVVPQPLEFMFCSCTAEASHPPGRGAPGDAQKVSGSPGAGRPAGLGDGQPRGVMKFSVERDQQTHLSVPEENICSAGSYLPLSASMASSPCESTIK